MYREPVTRFGWQLPPGVSQSDLDDDEPDPDDFEADCLAADDAEGADD